MGRGGTARPPEAEWSSGVAAFWGGSSNQDIFKDPKRHDHLHDHLSVLYSKDFKDVSREFDEFGVNTHLCKLRCGYLQYTMWVSFLYGRGPILLFLVQEYHFEGKSCISTTSDGYRSRSFVEKWMELRLQFNLSVNTPSKTLQNK